MYGSIGKLGITGFKCATNQAIANCTVNEELVNKKYLFYYIKSRQEHLLSMGKGGAQQNISQTVLKAYYCPIAPQNEQNRIAEKLDSILVKVDAAQARLDKIPNILKRFRQSVLAAATSGELTKDWILSIDQYYCEVDKDITKDKKLSKLSKVTEQELKLTTSLFGKVNWSRWKTYPLEQLVDSSRGIPYGIVQTGEAKSVGIPTIRCGDVKPLKILMTALKKVSAEIESKYIRTRLNGGEVLLAIRGTVGHAAVATQELVDLKANISREVAMIPVRDNVDSKYIAMLLQSPGGYRCLAEKVRGVAQKGINLADVKRFVTPLPSLEEQKEIVRRVESIFTMADTVEKQYLDVKARTNRLTQSILAKAFRGELVAQDENDEPAEKLLSKIQNELKNKPKNATRRTTNAKSVVKNMKLEDAPVGYLKNLMPKDESEIQAKQLWQDSKMTIDDFYAQLKKELINIEEINESLDPEARTLKVSKE